MSIDVTHWARSRGSIRVTRIVLACATLLLGACTTFSPHSGFDGVRTAVRERVDSDARWIRDKRDEREVRDLLSAPLTMVFRVNDSAMLDTVRAGDKIRFAADKVGGAYTVTWFETEK